MSRQLLESLWGAPALLGLYVLTIWSVAVGHRRPRTMKLRAILERRGWAPALPPLSPPRKHPLWQRVLVWTLYVAWVLVLIGFSQGLIMLAALNTTGMAQAVYVTELVVAVALAIYLLGPVPRSSERSTTAPTDGSDGDLDQKAIEHAAPRDTRTMRR